jgi:hypothetical protein
LIIAIGRGGYMPARIVSDYLDVYDLTGIRIVHFHAVPMQRVARVRYPLAAEIAVTLLPARPFGPVTLLVAGFDGKQACCFAPGKPGRRSAQVADAVMV